MPARKPPPWSRQELAVLREFYPREGIDCADRLADRSWQAIHQKAHKLGLRCEKTSEAPQPVLQGDALEEAIRLREEHGWSFARIAAKFDCSEAGACNAVLIALCPRRGFKPAERDDQGCLLPAGIQRLRYALKKGLKGVDIQLRLGLSAGRVAEERRRYNRELKAAGKVPLPPPGAGAAYSGVKLSAAKKREVEALFLKGLGTLKVSERAGVSKTSCTRIRNRLIKRLKRQGKTLTGCDDRGVRRVHKDSAQRIPEELKEALRAMILDRVPVRRAALTCAIGGKSAYQIRDELAAELAARGEQLPKPKLPGRSSVRVLEASWPPVGQREIFAFRAILQQMPFDEAKAEWRAQKRAERLAEQLRPKSFEEQLERVRRGEIGVTPAMPRAHLEPAAYREAVPA